MTGPAHENLHTFLGSYIPAVTSLAEAASLDEGQDALASVRTQLALYQEYFE